MTTFSVAALTMADGGATPGSVADLWQPHIHAARIGANTVMSKYRFMSNISPEIGFFHKRPFLVECEKGSTERVQ